MRLTNLAAKLSSLMVAVVIAALAVAIFITSATPASALPIGENHGVRTTWLIQPRPKHRPRLSPIKRELLNQDCRYVLNADTAVGRRYLRLYYRAQIKGKNPGRNLLCSGIQSRGLHFPASLFELRASIKTFERLLKPPAPAQPSGSQSLASWLEDGGATACGFHAYYGVANKYLACGTKVLFTYHGRHVTATVEDRGPYVGDRVWDLNQNTAAALGFQGVHDGWASYR